MEIIQQNFKVISKIGFILSLIATFFFISVIIFVDYDSLLIKILSIFIIILTITSIYNTYGFSFIYEFKQNEIISHKLFGLLGIKKYSIKSLTKIEYSISNKGIMDTINLYFNVKEKISINSFQVDLSKVRLFLYANVENFEELVDEKQRKWI